VDLGRLPLPRLRPEDLITLDEDGKRLSGLWSTLRAAMITFRDGCNATDSSGRLWNRLAGFWMLDRDAVFQAQAAKSSRAAHDGTAFI